MDRYKLVNVWKRFGRPDLPIDVGTANTPPTPPTGLNATSVTDTSFTLNWTLSTAPNITEQRIYLNNSRHTTVANGTSTSQTITGLTPGTTYVWKMTAYNASLAKNSGFSSTISVTTSATPPGGSPNVPTSPAAVKNPSSPTDSINVTWAAPSGGTAQTGYRVYLNGTQTGADKAAGATSHSITGLEPGGTYSVTIKAFNASGESVATTPVTVTLDAISTVTVMLMGCSDSPNDHGGTEVWDGWRVYTKSAMMARANKTGSEKPLFLAYSKDGPNLGGTNPVYNTVYNEVLDDLNEFYYGGTGNTPTARASIKLYWSNGNENMDKGALSLPHTQAKLDAYTVSQKALYDAVHYAPGGVRRFPNAFAGSNPTQNGEFNGDVQGWLHQSAQYHDFVMWSMYPPGRQQTVADPTYNWPTFTESERTDLRKGFLTRCFYRTWAAQQAARNATGNPNFNIMIGCGEVGIACDPGDNTTRPYYAVHGLAGAMYLLAQQYSLAMPFACWWDNAKDNASPQNVLTDEPVATNPSTATAWKNWLTLDHRRGGTHPGSWSSNPKAGWKDTGTPV